jgi:hypothetical protein
MSILHGVPPVLRLKIPGMGEGSQDFPVLPGDPVAVPAMAPGGPGRIKTGPIADMSHLQMETSPRWELIGTILSL